MEEDDIREKFETIQRDFASLDKGVSNIGIQLTDLIRRFAHAETLLHATIVTNTTVNDLTRRVAELEANKTWLWRTVTGVAIAAFMTAFVKFGGGK